jgi:hypothetical protein
MIRCRKCGVEKPPTTEFFYANKGAVSGLFSCCKLCHNQSSAAWAKENHARVRSRQNALRRAKRAAERLANPRKKKTKEEKLAKQAEWFRKNRIRVDAIKRAWYEANKDRCVVKDRDAYNARRRQARGSDPVQRLHNNISRSVRASLSSGKGGKTWCSIVGYDAKALKMHLERQFLKGMTWANYGEVWEVDHILPLKHFGKTFPEPDEAFIAAWALSNLRPLWAEANKRKNAKREFLI